MVSQVGHNIDQLENPSHAIYVEGKQGHICGDPSLERSIFTLKSMMKVIKKTKGGLLI